MQIKLPREIQNIFSKFSSTNYNLYLVGGAVRDLLMGKTVHDWDFTTDAKPEEILKIFPEGFSNNKFGTVGIPISVILNEVKNIYPSSSPQDDKKIIEITTMRKEGDYSDHRHPTEVGWTDKIEEDLARRDFTINAIAMSQKLELVDPYNGQSDLEKKLVRAVGDPINRFQEDALRLMRAIRIAAELDFEIEDKTKQAIIAQADLIKEVSWERIRDELLKLLASKNPYSGFLLLRETTLLQTILPELERCFGLEQVGPKHDREYDIGEHSLLTLKHCPSSNPLVRLAALLHDIGKPDTKSIQKDTNVTFYNHEVVGANIVLEITKRLRLSKNQSEKLYKLVRWHMFSLNESQTDSAIRRFIKNVGQENIEDMMTIRIGDRLGGGTQKAISWRMEKFKERIIAVLKKPFSITDLKINGKDVMEILQIKPGPKVGEILGKLFQEVLEDSERNNHEYLFKRVAEINKD